MPAKVPSLKGKVGGDAATPPPTVGDIATPRTDRSTPRSAGHVRLSDLPGGAGASNPTSPENVGDWDAELDRLQRARSPRVTPRNTPQINEDTPSAVVDGLRSSLGGRSGGSQVLARRDEAESGLPRFQQSTASRPSSSAIEQTFASRPSSASSVRQHRWVAQDTSRKFPSPCRYVSSAFLCGGGWWGRGTYEREVWLSSTRRISATRFLSAGASVGVQVLLSLHERVYGAVLTDVPRGVKRAIAGSQSTWQRRTQSPGQCEPRATGERRFSESVTEETGESHAA
jgi:hypothetical protein